MKKTPKNGKNFGIAVNGQIILIGENSMKVIFLYRTMEPKFGSGILN